MRRRRGVRGACLAAGLAMVGGCTGADSENPGATTATTTGGSGGGGASSSSSAGGANATGPTGGVGGAGGAPSDKVPMFVAQGEVGTTVVSCDDGKTWTGLRSFETEAHPLVCGRGDAVRCYDDGSGCHYLDDGQCVVTDVNCDCNHHPGAGKGLAYGDGAFVATFGWGYAGLVLRSTDGFRWTEVQSGDTWADVAAGDGRIVLSGRTPMVSTDGGQTYTAGGKAEHGPFNVRRLFFLPTSGSFLQSAASGNDRDLLLSDDGLMTWRPPTSLPADCARVRSILEAGGTIVINTGEDYVCRSDDNGDTFTRVDLPGGPNLFSGPVHDGSQFIVWGSEGGVKAYTSADGTVWTAAETNLGNERFGEVARNPVTGTMVAARSQWQQWYEDMRWYRSADGLTWETLPPNAGPETHAIREMTFGWADPSAACP
ncbi:MAG: hypothetical protein AAF715_17790 [Myxococcota bacterium]